MKDYDIYNDYCDECRAYGNNYSYDDQGELVSNCIECNFNEKELEE